MVESMLGRTYNDSFMIYIILHVKQTKKQTNINKQKSDKQI